MKTTQRKLTRAAVLTLVVFLIALLVSSTALAGAAPRSFDDPLPALPEGEWYAPDLPSGPDGVLPDRTCPYIGSLAQYICVLWLRETSMTLPDGSSIPVLGVSPNSLLSFATVPGPTMILHTGDTVTFSTYNRLNATGSLSIPGIDMVPDLAGFPHIITKNYGPITLADPGTFIYQAGFASNSVKQTARGIYGAMIVRPSTPLQAYNDAGSAYTDEAVLVFSEVDVDLLLNPASFEMSKYAPEYRLVNGKAYNQVPNIPVNPGSTLLLRLVNAGLEERSVGVMGLNMTQIATNGNRLPFDYSFFARPMGSGSTMDVLVKIPANVPVGARYPVINTAMAQAHNNGVLAGDGSVAFGGAITFIEVTGNTPIADTGPLASNLSVTPNPASTLSDLTVSARFDETTTGGELVVAAEYFTDTVGLPGTGTAFSFTPGVTVDVSATIPFATLSSWPPGDITFYMRGQDADGTWGPLSSTVLDLVAAGPVVRSLSVTPAVSNGTRAVTLRGTADDTATGNIDVAAVEYFLGAPGANGTGLPVTQNKVAPVVGLSAEIPVATMQTLAEGLHPIYIHGVDALGNWGGFSVVTMTVDLTGPSAVGLDVNKTPNNGKLGLNSSMYVMRARAMLTDLANITKVEGFFETQGANGTGFAWIPADGLFNSNNELVYVDIPLTTVAQFANGPHTILMHGLDVAGNWGSFGTLEFVIDKTAPATSGLLILPNPTGGAASVTLTANANDPANGAAPGSKIVAAEWYENLDPGLGMATPLSAQDGAFDSPNEVVTAVINASGWTNANHTISVRSKDAAGNWGPVVQTTLSVTGNAMNHVLLDSFESGNLMSVWNFATPNVYNSYGAALEGVRGARVMLREGLASYLVDRTPSAEASYRASFLLNTNGLATAGAGVDIFTGEDAEGNAIFGLEYARGVESAELRAWVISGGERSYTAWTRLADSAQKVEIAWHSGARSSFWFTVDDKPVTILRDVNTSAYRLETVKLGVNAGYAADIFGSLFFDAFESYRLLPEAPSFKVYMPSVSSGVTQ